MLLKWLFTILAIIWLYQALRPILGAQQGPNLRQKPPEPPPPNHDDDKGEYIDYEEIK